MLEFLNKYKFLFVFCILYNVSCSSFPNRNEILFHPKLYAGSYHEGAIVRTQSKEVIQCTDRKFNDFVCLSYTDLLNVQYALDSCQRFE